VILQAGTGSNYTCSYASGHYSVLNITDSKIFTVQGGIVKYGIGSLETFWNYYFIIVNGTRGASLCLSGVEIEFANKMNSMVCILGWEVTLEDVKINNQLDISSLVFSYSNTSSVTVNFHSCTITNSNYKNANSTNDKSAVVYFISQNTATQYSPPKSIPLLTVPHKKMICSNTTKKKNNNKNNRSYYIYTKKISFQNPKK
jgi:hypothetical protein